MSPKSPLGKPSTYPQQYAPELLHPIARLAGRDTLRLAGQLPFDGIDIWNAWELTWLDADGKPHVAIAEIRIPAASPNIVESKSLKLYLNSFSMSRYGTEAQLAATIEQDISGCVDAGVTVDLRQPETQSGSRIGRLPGHCIDAIDVACHSYEVDSGLLAADPGTAVREDLYSHLLRSLCPVTSQPDTGSLLVSYHGPQIDRAALLRYIVSFREHSDFHEACVERMFIDILERCKPKQLTVYARYHRRGGIDINPFRSNFEASPPNIRLWRQ